MSDRRPLAPGAPVALPEPLADHRHEGLRRLHPDTTLKLKIFDIKQCELNGADLRGAIEAQVDRRAPRLTGDLLVNGGLVAPAPEAAGGVALRRADPGASVACWTARSDVPVPAPQDEDRGDQEGRVEEGRESWHMPQVPVPGTMWGVWANPNSALECASMSLREAMVVVSMRRVLGFVLLACVSFAPRKMA